jgi:hypothetical protein
MPYFQFHRYSAVCTSKKSIAQCTRFEFSNFEFCVQRTKICASLLRHASSIAAPTLLVIRTLSHQQFLPASQRTASEKHRTNVPRRPHQLPPFLSLQTTCILSRQRVLPRNRPTASVKSPPRLPRPPHQSWLSRLRVSINEVLQKLNSLSASELVGQFECSHKWCSTSCAGAVSAAAAVAAAAGSTCTRYYALHSTSTVPCSRCWHFLSSP